MKTKRLLVICLGSILALLVVIIILVTSMGKKKPANVPPQPTTKGEATTVAETEAPTQDPFLNSASISVNLLPINEYSRPGTELKEVKGIVIHYVGNAGSTAVQNRDHFASLAETHERSASSHYIIGLQGEIIQCVPLNEISYASNERNMDTIAIECCHPKEDGIFTSETYQSLVQLTSALCRSYGLDPKKDVIRHYDVTLKECPKYYVDHPEAWETFRSDVQARMRLEE